VSKRRNCRNSLSG